MKELIPASGSGMRLYPITEAISKPLMLVYDKLWLLQQGHEQPTWTVGNPCE